MAERPKITMEDVSKDEKSSSTPVSERVVTRAAPSS